MAQGRGTTHAGETDTPILEHFPPLPRNRNFLLLFGSYVVSVLGDRVHFLVMLQLLCVVILRRKTVDTPHFAQLNLAMFLPFFLLAPLAGIVADRLPRRRIMITCDLSRAVLVIIARTVLLAGAIHGWLAVPGLLWLLFGSEVVLSIFGEMFSPARAALLPNLVHPQQLLQANAWINPAGTIVTLIGFLVGGWLVTWRLDYAMYVDAVTYCVSAACVIAMHLPRGVDKPGLTSGRQTMRASLRDGMGYLRCHCRPLQVIGLELAFFLISSLILNGLPSMVHHQPRYLYLTMALTGLGMIGGALALSRARQNIPKEIGIGWSVVLVGISLLLAAHAQSWPALVLWLIVTACFGSIMFISVDTLLQRIVPDYVRGRVMGVRDLITTGGLIAMTIPMAIMPHIGALVVYLVYGFGGLALMLGVALVIFYYRGKTLPVAQVIALQTVRAYMVLWHRYKRVGPCRIPGHGPVIVATNRHNALASVALLVSSPRRLIQFMVERQYQASAFLGPILRAGRSIPFERSEPDAAKVNSALGVLRAGGVVGLFSEDGMSADGQLRPGESGVAALAMRSKAPVVPVYVQTARRHAGPVRDFLWPGKVRVFYGAPLHFTHVATGPHDQVALQQMMDQIMQAIGRLQAKAEGLTAESSHGTTGRPMASGQRSLDTEK